MLENVLKTLEETFDFLGIKEISDDFLIKSVAHHSAKIILDFKQGESSKMKGELGELFFHISALLYKDNALFRGSINTTSKKDTEEIILSILEEVTKDNRDSNNLLSLLIDLANNTGNIDLPVYMIRSYHVDNFNNLISIVD